MQTGSDTLMEEMADEVLSLCFIRLVGMEGNGCYRYEFMFTNNIDETWGEDWEQLPAALVNDMKPSDEYVTEVHMALTNMQLSLAQENACFGMQDCIDGIVSLAWCVNGNYEIHFNFGETFDEVEKKLAEKSIIFN